jgi:type II secretory pathway component PulK
MKNDKASILILVLWVLIILSLLSIAVSSHSSADIKLAKYEAGTIKALYLAKAGVARMIAELNKDNNDFDSLNEDWNKEQEFSFGEGKVICKAYDEEARFNLNASNLGKYKEILMRLGLDSDMSQKLLDYRVTKGEKGFEFMEELFLIDGMTKDIYSMIEPYVTIYRGNEQKVNINTASESILKIVLGEDVALINRIIIYREGNYGETGIDDAGIFTEDNFSSVFRSFGITPDYITDYQALFSVRSNFFRVVSSASFSENTNIVKDIETVVDRKGKIYYWKEE